MVFWFSGIVVACVSRRERLLLENGACCGHYGQAGEHRGLLLLTKQMTQLQLLKMRDKAMRGQMRKSNVVCEVVKRKIVTE